MDFQIVKNTSGISHIDFGNGRNTQGFYQLAKRLETILAIRYNKKTDNFNTLSWNYFYQGVPFILRYHWDTGILIQLESKSPTQDEEHKMDDIAEVLKTFL